MFSVFIVNEGFDVVSSISFVISLVLDTFASILDSVVTYETTADFGTILEKLLIAREVLVDCLVTMEVMLGLLGKASVTFAEMEIVGANVAEVGEIDLLGVEIVLEGAVVEMVLMGVVMALVFWVSEVLI